MFLRNVILVSKNNHLSSHPSVQGLMKLLHYVYANADEPTKLEKIKKILNIFLFFSFDVDNGASPSRYPLDGSSTGQ